MVLYKKSWNKFLPKILNKGYTHNENWKFDRMKLGGETVKKWCLLFVFGISFLFSPIKTEALSCAELVSPKTEFEHSDVVFHGKAVNIKKDRYTFEVITSYKGEVKEEFVGYDSVSMWLSEKVKEGKEYLVYATYDKERKDYLISPCGRTDLWEVRKDDVSEFPKKEDVVVEKTIETKEKQKENTNEKSKESDVYYWFASIIGGIAIFYFSVLLLKRKE